jgi:hypothetical protein
LDGVRASRIWQAVFWTISSEAERLSKARGIF